MRVQKTTALPEPAFLSQTRDAARKEQGQGEQQGQEEHGPPPEGLDPKQVWSMHAQMDANKDGHATIEEMLTYGKEMRRRMAIEPTENLFRDMDKDNDTFLSLEEILNVSRPTEKVSREAMIEEITATFRAADRDKDGKLEPREALLQFFPEHDPKVLAAATLEAFKRLDTDRNGQVDQKEFERGVENEQERHDFVWLDKNHDGLLHPTELSHWHSRALPTEKALRRLMLHADSDLDGMVTPEELDIVGKVHGQTEEYSPLLAWARVHSEL